MWSYATSQTRSGRSGSQLRSFPRFHRLVAPGSRWNGPKHADAWASFEDQDGATKVTLGMVFSTAAEFQEAKGFGAVELGLQTLGKLERFVASR